MSKHVKFKVSPLEESILRHFATAAVSAFAVAILPVVQDLGAGKYNVSADKALAVAAASGAVAAGLRAAVSFVAGKVSVSQR